MKSKLAGDFRRDMAGVAVLALLVLAMGLWSGRSFYMSLLTYAAIYAIAAVGLQILFGFAGQISLSQAAFFGVGAYACALLAGRLPHLAALGASALIAGGFGWFVSRPLLKLTTNYLAMGTLAFGLICFIVFAQVRPLTGGLDPGILSMPTLTVFGMAIDSAPRMLWLVGATLCAVMLTTLGLAHSRIGRALRALNSSEVAAAGLGVDVVRYKVAAFTLSAILAGLAGALFAFAQGAFNASSFGVGLSIELLVMVVVGSLLTLWGALFGALFVTLLPALLEHFELYRLLVYGVMLTVVMVYMPEGLGRALMNALRSGWKQVVRK